MAHRVSKPTTAYVLINCEPGTQTVVIDELRTVPQVVEAYEIYGSICDMLAKVTANNENKLKEVIRNSIRRIEKIRSTQTMTVVMTIYSSYLIYL
jgi:DNA-binding Lrp family transcriptional regulator